MFHLMTHAFFKALLFLGAGSVIIAMHHEQDMRKMGGLARHMPVTYLTTLLGALALIGFPAFSGFFSKDAIIEATHAASGAGLPGATYAYWSVLLGVFVTALYTFRMIFLVFHGRPRMDAETRSHLHESPWVVTLPLVLLAVPSVLIGWFTEEPILFGNWFGEAIQVRGEDPLAAVAAYGTDPWHFLIHGITASPTFFSAAGLLTAWWLYLLRPGIPAAIADRAGGLYRLLQNKYYFDDVNDKVFAAGARSTGNALWRVGDQTLIDGGLVNGSARVVNWLSGVSRQIQTGYLYHYAFAMFIGLAAMLGWLLIKA